MSRKNKSDVIVPPTTVIAADPVTVNVPDVPAVIAPTPAADARTAFDNAVKDAGIAAVALTAARAALTAARTRVRVTGLAHARAVSRSV